MIAGNFVLVHYVRALDAHLLAEVDKYDPGTPEAERASEEWASDTGRSFALAFSAPLTAIWYLALFLLLFGSRWILGQMSPTRPTSVHAQTDSETVVAKLAESFGHAANTESLGDFPYSQIRPFFLE